MGSTVAEIRAILGKADAVELAALERSLVADGRKGVRTALEAARRRIAAEAGEAARVEGLYAFDAGFFDGALQSENEREALAGFDEVGRGAVAGPLAVGAVVLPEDPRIDGLNDSKKLTPKRREEVAAHIKRRAVCWKVFFVDPSDIDAHGMAASLRRAFSGALDAIESEGTKLAVALVDGNSLGIDAREANVVRGDSKSAAIAAASIVAKVSRDEIMRSLDSTFPHYGFSDNKGYASPEHIEAIRTYGLSPVHRASFCRSFMQGTLF